MLGKAYLVLMLEGGTYRLLSQCLYTMYGYIQTKIARKPVEVEDARSGWQSVSDEDRFHRGLLAGLCLPRLLRHAEQQTLERLRHLGSAFTLFCSGCRRFSSLQGRGRSSFVPNAGRYQRVVFVQCPRFRGETDFLPGIHQGQRPSGIFHHSRIPNIHGTFSVDLLVDSSPLQLPAALVSASVAVGTAPGRPRSRGRRVLEKKVKPLLVGNCFTCRRARPLQGGILDDLAEAGPWGGNRQPAVVPGHPEGCCSARFGAGHRT